MQSQAKTFESKLMDDQRPKMITTSKHFISRTAQGSGKTSFLVYKSNKYQTVPTELIAFFYIKFESTMLVNFAGQEYSLDYSLEQIQNLLPENQFFRLNRQYLLNFNSVIEVEHYYARKLLVKTSIPFAERLIVSKERARIFLNWLGDR